MSLQTDKVVPQHRIVLQTWRDCDTYVDCPLCGPGKPDEGPQIILRRWRTEPFAVADGKLTPVCLDCAERIAPESYAEWKKIARREFDEEQAMRQAAEQRRSRARRSTDVELPLDDGEIPF